MCFFWGFASRLFLASSSFQMSCRRRSVEPRLTLLHGAPNVFQVLWEARARTFMKTWNLELRIFKRPSQHFPRPLPGSTQRRARYACPSDANPVVLPCSHDLLYKDAWGEGAFQREFHSLGSLRVQGLWSIGWLEAPWIVLRRRGAIRPCMQGELLPSLTWRR